MDTSDIFILTGDTISTSFWLFGLYNTIYLIKYNGELPPPYWPTFNCANHPCIGGRTCAELELKRNEAQQRYLNAKTINEIEVARDELKELSQCYLLVCQ